jgi:hypothetical protein
VLLHRLQIIKSANLFRKIRETAPYHVSSLVLGRGSVIAFSIGGFSREIFTIKSFVYNQSAENSFGRKVLLGDLIIFISTEDHKMRFSDDL